VDNKIYYCTYCICQQRRYRIKITLLIHSHYELREPSVLATAMHTPLRSRCVEYLLSNSKLPTHFKKMIL